jgi:hypothetical protein
MALPAAGTACRDGLFPGFLRGGAMIYQVNMEKFSVEKQAESWLCWAATAKAVAAYKGLGSPDQQGLATLYADKAQGNSPAKVLKDKYQLTAANLVDWPVKAAGAELRQRQQDLRDNLKYNLTDRGPFLSSMTEANDSKWTITTSQGVNPNYVFRHATLLFKYDDGADVAYLADPARSDARGRYVGVSIADLVGGFDYIKASDLGPKASAMLPTGMTDIRVRLYRLDYFA